MNNLTPFPSLSTVKRWIEYWLKFKGKRVRVYLRSGINLSHELANPLKSLNLGSNTIFKMDLPENLTGTIIEVVENPFGILLKDVSIPEDKEVEGAFIPMSEISKMYVLKKEQK